MLDEETRRRLASAQSMDEVKGILTDHPEIDAERVWKEIAGRRAAKAERLDLDELDAVSGGWDRDWTKDGCAATCEEGSWCWSNDRCSIFDVTYGNFWAKCPDGHPHEYNSDKVCVRCGHHYNGWTGEYFDN